MSTQAVTPSAATAQAATPDPAASATGITPQGQAPAAPAQAATGDQSGQGQAPTPEQVTALRQEAANYRTQLRAEQEKVKAFEQAQMTDQQKADAQAATDRATATEATAKLARYEVAAEKGLPLSMAMRLQGNTAEEMKQDADKLIAEFGLTPTTAGQAPQVQQGRVPNFDAGARPNGAEGDMNALIRRSAGMPV